MIMKVLICKSGEFSVLETWDNYPVVPNIGDLIAIGGMAFSKKVVARKFHREYIVLLVKD